MKKVQTPAGEVELKNARATLDDHTMEQIYDRPYVLGHFLLEAEQIRLIMLPANTWENGTETPCVEQARRWKSREAARQAKLAAHGSEKAAIEDYAYEVWNLRELIPGLEVQALRLKTEREKPRKAAAPTKKRGGG